MTQDTTEKAQDGYKWPVEKTGVEDTPASKQPATTLTASVETFLASATWLTDLDEPMVTSLRMLANEIDCNGVTAALHNTFGVTYRTLLKRSNNKDEVDDAEQFLNSL